METSEALPAGAVEAPDLADLAARPGPLLSILFGTEGAVENAAQRSETRWRSLRASLESARVPDAALRLVDPLVSDAHRYGDVLVAIADAEVLWLVEHGPGSPPRDEGWWEPLPRLLPVFRWRQEQPPFMVVLVDRTGADVHAFRRGASDVEEEVEGDDFPITKVHAGGWSQRRYQERAEQTWERNADTVAEVVQRLAQRVKPKLIVVAGDVRAVSLLRGSLPEEVAALVRESAGGAPAHEGPGRAMPDDVDALVAEVVRGEEAALLQRVEEERGQGDLLAEGTARTAEALSKAQAAIVFVPAEDDSKVWIGPEPVELATDPEQLRALGVDEPIEARRTDAFVRGALGTGAGIRVIDAAHRLRDGVGALLRWSTTPP